MKHLANSPVRRWPALLFTLLACAVLAVADGLLQVQELTKTNASASVPVRVSAVRGMNVFKTATFYGKLHARTNNTGTVYLGTNSTNDTQAISIAAGEYVVITAPPNSYFDLYDFYLDVATTNDGVVVVYAN